MATSDIPAGRKRLLGKSSVARVLNGMLWMVFCALTGTGLLLAFRLPPGSGRHLATAGLTRHEWGDWHTWFSYAFLVLMAVHLALHWRWFWQVAAKKRSWPLLLGFGAGVVLILLLALQPVSRVVEKEREGKGRGGRTSGWEERDGVSFRGREAKQRCVLRQ